MKDYHQLNPDRNRALDLYPLFAHVDPETVHQGEDISSVSARPTYHYRLPNYRSQNEDGPFK